LGISWTTFLWRPVSFDLMDVVSLRERDSGKKFKVRIGDAIEVRLRTNPTTGFRWERTSEVCPILEVSMVGDFRPDSNAIGSGGVILMSFMARNIGQTTLRLIERRPWEEGIPPINVFQVELQVD